MLAGATQLPTIETPRLRLRWLTPGDVPALFVVFSDPDVCRYWSRSPMTDLAEAAALQAEIARGFADRTLFQWGIAERTADRVVGTCTLWRLSGEHRRAEVGFALASSVWRRGYLAEALPALLAFAFTELGLERIEADTDPRNARSIHVLEREGFQREGYLRERYHVAGEVQDTALYGLLKREWRGGAHPAS